MNREFEYIKIKRRDLLQIAWASCRIRFRQSSYYTWGLILMPAKLITDILIFFILTSLVSPALNPYIIKYGGDYLGFVFIGIIIGPWLSFILGTFYWNFKVLYWGDANRLFYNIPRGSLLWIMGSTVSEVISLTMRTTFLVLAGIVLGISFSLSSWVNAIFILLIGMLSLTGLGLIGASTFVLLKAKVTNPVSWILSMLIKIFSGYYFPIDALPTYLLSLSYALPQTHIFEAIRFILLGGRNLTDPLLVHNFLYLSLFTALTLPLGIALFKEALERGEEDAELALWK